GAATLNTPAISITFRSLKTGRTATIRRKIRSISGARTRRRISHTITRSRKKASRVEPHREAVMGYTLKQFCEDHHALLTSGQPLDRTLPQIAEKLSVLLRNPDFVAGTFKDDTPVGRRTLAHDPDTDVYVLAHVYEGPKKGTPHNHGASW